MGDRKKASEVITLANISAAKLNPSIFEAGSVVKSPIPGVAAGGEAIDVPQKLANWGKKNNLPQEREALVKGNNIIPQLISTKRDIIMGQGIKPYRSVWQEEEDKYVLKQVRKQPAAEAFFKQIDIHAQMLRAIGELLKHGCYFIEIIGAEGADEIADIDVKYSRHIRCAEKNEEGNIPGYFFHDSWKMTTSSGDAIFFPVYDPEEDITGKSRMLCVADELFIGDYYPTPDWWGGWEWIELSNIIPHFHQANLKNGYTPRAHVEMPEDYFDDYSSEDTTPEAEAKRKKASEQAKQDFIDNVEKFLGGTDNAGKTLFTEYSTEDSSKKKYGEIFVKSLKFELQDEALLKLYDKTNTANISAQGVHPTLANIETAGKLSSGTEIRNAFLMYLIIKVPRPRKLTGWVIEVVKRHNNWPEEIEYHHQDFEMTALSESKSGTKESREDDEGAIPGGAS